MKKTDLAWAAGFFDGEGCVRFRDNKFEFISFTQKNVEPLTRLKKLFGLGNIYTCHSKYKGKSYPMQKYIISGRDAVLILSLLFPYLTVKRDEATKAILAGDLIRPKARSPQYKNQPKRFIERKWDIAELTQLVVLKKQGLSFSSIGKIYDITRQRASQLYWYFQNSYQIKNNGHFF
jgi:hypothetical protein